MNKAVLISVKPQWREKIASGKKTIEVRKTKPKLETPFKCYIYCTKEKVIGEFVCDNIEQYSYDAMYGYYTDGFNSSKDDISEICLTMEELHSYGKGKTLYGWHISDLKIYDEPKELSEFRKPCKQKFPCERCGLSINDGSMLPWGDVSVGCDNLITQPPQSWCYAEIKQLTKYQLGGYKQ